MHRDRPRPARGAAPGYHSLRAYSAGQQQACSLIVPPAWLGLPARLGTRKVWGLATQLYSVRSRRSWGVGDLTDLSDLAVWAGADHDAAFVLVNPLHAAEPVPPTEPSPYVPTTRRFASPLYLRVERIPEYVYLDVETRQEIDRLAGTALASVDVVDRDTSWTAAALKATPSRRRFLALTDAVGERRTQNQPGTVDEYSNWRAPLSGPDGRPMCLEDIYTSDRAAVLAETMRES